MRPIKMVENADGRADASMVERALAELRTAAPATLLPKTLVATGLADAYVARKSPLGTIFIAFNGTGVSAVRRATDPSEFESDFRREFGRPIYRAAELPARLEHGIEARMGGDRRARISFDLRNLTDFERAVLRKALEIPTGEVRSYGWIAAEIGRPQAVRAVGSALGHNPIPLLIPCHRVVRSDGQIGQYSLGGPEAKRTVLEAEGLDVTGLEELARRGVRYLASDTTGIFCHPTCRNARRITARHRVELHSVSEAGSGGYRPCRVCRPAIAA